MTVLITLTTAGNNTGPFDLYSNADGYTVAFETNIPRIDLVSGYTSTVVPTGTTDILVQSTGACDRDLYLNIAGAPTTTTTSTTSTSSTTSTTTTLPPGDCLTGDTNAIATCSNGDSAEFTINVGYKAEIIPGGYFYSGSGTRTYTAYIMNSTNTTILYTFNYIQVGSSPGTWTSNLPLNTLIAGTYRLRTDIVNCFTSSGTFSLQVGDCSVA